MNRGIVGRIKKLEQEAGVCEEIPISRLTDEELLDHIAAMAKKIVDRKIAEERKKYTAEQRQAAVDEKVDWLLTPEGYAWAHEHR
jgi:hypothetical protein